jgi:hypothetical protein
MVPTLMKPELNKNFGRIESRDGGDPRRRSKLAEHDSLIGAMRDQGAPWTTVQRYLAKAGVEISAEAYARIGIGITNVADGPRRPLR